MGSFIHSLMCSNSIKFISFHSRPSLLSIPLDSVPFHSISYHFISLHFASLRFIASLLHSFIPSFLHSFIPLFVPSLIHVDDKKAGNNPKPCLYQIQDSNFATVVYLCHVQYMWRVNWFVWQGHILRSILWDLLAGFVWQGYSVRIAPVDLQQVYVWQGQGHTKRRRLFRDRIMKQNEAEKC